jgi:hypothetical protein
LAREIPEGVRLYDILVGLDQPSPQEIGASDRYAAIVGSSLLEHGLKEAISVYLRDDGDAATSKKELFDNHDRSPLATFSERIVAAYALGIIDKTTRDNLDIIRDIRNSFAHSIMPVEFSSPECIREFARLNPQKEIFVGEWRAWSPRRKFGSLVFIYYHALFTYAILRIERPKPLSFS